MGQAWSGAPAFIREPGEYEFRDGMFYVTDAAGTRAITPNAFFRAFRSAAKAIQDYHATEGAEIVRFPGLHAASS